MFVALERPEEGTPGKATLLGHEWAQDKPGGEKRENSGRKGVDTAIRYDRHLLLFLGQGA